MTVVENLTPGQHTNRALHNAITRIGLSWPQALEDANARGYPAGVGYGAVRGLSENTSVETAALTPSKAVAWLAELGDVLEAYGVTKYRVSRERMIGHMAWMVDNEPGSITEHTIRQTIRLANTACTLWPPPAKPGDKRVKQFDSETCLVCKIDAYPGDRRAVKNPDGSVEGYAHKTPCWYQILMARGNHPRQKTVS